MKYIFRDLGEHLRKQAKTIFATENSTSLKDDQLDQQIQALERLSKNTYGVKYPRLRNSTSTGLTAEQCNQVLSSEFLDYLNDDKGKGLFTK